ncbi:hypothetical protein [Antarctobacter sp.]|uniref:hypothetical protein n=1 Tax=Antarctobacter sp. TaxID=1872577 RepID=UPI002B277610|nr:hypothetical protein [Antarctobacter sp.]
MSDPVTNVEIEDVLSSIRRLVSEEERPPRGAQRPVPERLVLSPALRVPEAVDPPTAMPGKAREAQAPMVLTEPSVAPVTQNAPPVADPDEDATLVLGAEDVAEGVASDIADWSETRVAETIDPPVNEPAAIDLVDTLDLVGAVDPVDPHGDPDMDLADVDTASPEVAETVADPDETEVPDDTAEEADQIAALRASLTGILVPDTTSAPADDDDLDPAIATDDAKEQSDPLAAVQTADQDDGKDMELDRKIAALELMLERQSKDWAPTTPLSETRADPDGVPASNTDADQNADAPDAAEDAATAVDLADEGPLAEDSGPDPLIEEIVTAAALATLADHVADTAETDAPETDTAETDTPETLTLSYPVDTDPDGTGPADEAASAVPEDAISAVPGEARPAFVRHAPSEALDWEDHAPQAVADPDPAPDAQPEQATAVAELSEEALQAVVSEIVRQELQGALGERITRNVRKLVRREIHRVLMSKDLD